MIDARAFKPDYPHPRGTFAAELHGNAREQWKRWYWSQRMARAGRTIAQGEIGTFHGVTFVADEPLTRDHEAKA